MLESLILYSFCVYFFFHVVARASFLDTTRDYIKGAFPPWATYPLDCAFCFCFHLGWIQHLYVWVASGFLIVSIGHLLVAPVIVFLTDLVVRLILSHLDR